jgi:hypothetical protein
LLISQDHDQVFLSFAYYSTAYEDYLRGKELKGDADTADAKSFLVMHQYGPWSIRAVEQVKHLSRFVLAFALRMSQEGSVKGGLFLHENVAQRD